MIIDELDDIKCEECYGLAIEDIAAFAIDPENLARLDPEAGNDAVPPKAPRYAQWYLGRASPRPRLQGQGRVGILQS